jgi:hypothetical protein
MLDAAAEGSRRSREERAAADSAAAATSWEPDVTCTRLFAYRSERATQSQRLYRRRLQTAHQKSWIYQRQAPQSLRTLTAPQPGQTADSGTAFLRTDRNNLRTARRPRR